MKWGEFVERFRNNDTEIARAEELSLKTQNKTDFGIELDRFCTANDVVCEQRRLDGQLH